MKEREWDSVGVSGSECVGVSGCIYTSVDGVRLIIGILDAINKNIPNIL